MSSESFLKRFIRGLCIVEEFSFAAQDSLLLTVLRRLFWCNTYYMYGVGVQFRILILPKLLSCSLFNVSFSGLITMLGKGELIFHQGITRNYVK